MDIEKQSYEAIADRTFETDSVTLVNVGVKGKYKVGETLYLNSEVSFGEEVYLHAPDTSTISFDKGSTFKTSLGLGFNLVQLSDLKIGAELGTKGILGADIEDYQSEGSLGYYCTLQLDHEYKGKTLLASIEYEMMNKNTTSFEQEHTNLQFNLGVTWGFGN